MSEAGSLMLSRWRLVVRNPPASVRDVSLGQEDSLEEEMTTHSSILVWRIQWTEEPGGLQSMGLQSQIPLGLLSTHHGEASDSCAYLQRAEGLSRERETCFCVALKGKTRPRRNALGRNTWIQHKALSVKILSCKQ